MEPPLLILAMGMSFRPIMRPDPAFGVGVGARVELAKGENCPKAAPTSAWRWARIASLPEPAASMLLASKGDVTPISSISTSTSPGMPASAAACTNPAKLSAYMSLCSAHRMTSTTPLDSLNTDSSPLNSHTLHSNFALSGPHTRQTSKLRACHTPRRDKQSTLALRL